ncbi:MAG: hypothetical protein L6Q98_08885 [Anaerolineae bacterium]|nr:hypothetical protein [Anaerolineae bacterium]NUQ05036.1 hypothetical protein [Anaerolineae bacterium]
MINQSDVQGRLRLLRYGLVVMVIVAFLVALLAPYSATAPVANAAGTTPIQITDFLGNALLYAVIVAVVAVIVYVVYTMMIRRGSGG